MFDTIIIGGGIVGLATARAILTRSPGNKLLVLEKEDGWGKHQTGHNSGVIHSGIYYKPGSFKARFARKGSQSMVEFCRAHAIPVDVCGKIIVATQESELKGLDNLYQRGLQNGLAVTKLTAEQAREIEPHVSCVAAVRVPETGITDYKLVVAKLAELIATAGGELKTGDEGTGLRLSPTSTVVQTKQGEFEAKLVINCAGLHSDRIARMAHATSKNLPHIVPFRGEYYELTPAKRHLVKHLIYPVPNPDFPFLGVHLTRMSDGTRHAGPNAVLALKREGYTWKDISPKDLAEVMVFPGFWKLVIPYAREGLMEMWRSFSKAAFVHSLARLVPEITENDVIPTHAGVRAQALAPDGKLVDDFMIVREQNTIHVLNAPSPAATGSLEIGEEIADRALKGNV